MSPQQKLDESKDQLARPDRELMKWQRSMIPLMGGTLVLVTVFFLAATTVQLWTLEQQLNAEPALVLSEHALNVPVTSAEPFENRLAASRFRATAEMEVQVVRRRYAQASALLRTRLWISYLGFLTGMILALVGAAFILGKLREADTELKSGDWALKTASPGIVLTVLGAALMIITVQTNHRIEVTDTALYLRDSALLPAPATTAEPVPVIPEPNRRK